MRNDPSDDPGEISFYAPKSRSTHHSHRIMNDSRVNNLAPPITSIDPFIKFTVKEFANLRVGGGVVQKVVDWIVRDGDDIVWNSDSGRSLFVRSNTESHREISLDTWVCSCPNYNEICSHAYATAAVRPEFRPRAAVLLTARRLVTSAKYRGNVASGQRDLGESLLRSLCNCVNPRDLTRGLAEALIGMTWSWDSEIMQSQDNNRNCYKRTSDLLIGVVEFIGKALSAKAKYKLTNNEDEEMGGNEEEQNRNLAGWVDLGVHDKMWALEEYLAEHFGFSDAINVPSISRLLGEEAIFQKAMNRKCMLSLSACDYLGIDPHANDGSYHDIRPDKEGLREEKAKQHRPAVSVLEALKEKLRQQQLQKKEASLPRYEVQTSVLFTKQIRDRCNSLIFSTQDGTVDKTHSNTVANHSDGKDLTEMTQEIVDDNVVHHIGEVKENNNGCCYLSIPADHADVLANDLIPLLQKSPASMWASASPAASIMSRLSCDCDSKQLIETYLTRVHNDLSLLLSFLISSPLQPSLKKKLQLCLYWSRTPEFQRSQLIQIHAASKFHEDASFHNFLKRRDILSSLESLCVPLHLIPQIDASNSVHNLLELYIPSFALQSNSSVVNDSSLILPVVSSSMSQKITCHPLVEPAESLLSIRRACVSKTSTFDVASFLSSLMASLTSPDTLNLYPFSSADSLLQWRWSGLENSFGALDRFASRNASKIKSTGLCILQLASISSTAFNIPSLIWLGICDSKLQELLLLQSYMNARNEVQAAFWISLVLVGEIFNFHDKQRIKRDSGENDFISSIYEFFLEKCFQNMRDVKGIKFVFDVLSILIKCVPDAFTIHHAAIPVPPSYLSTSEIDLDTYGSSNPIKLILLTVAKLVLPSHHISLSDTVYSWENFMKQEIIPSSFFMEHNEQLNSSAQPGYEHDEPISFAPTAASQKNLLAQEMTESISMNQIFNSSHTRPTVSQADADNSNEDEIIFVASKVAKNTQEPKVIHKDNTTSSKILTSPATNDTITYSNNQSDSNKFYLSPNPSEPLTDASLSHQIINSIREIEFGVFDGQNISDLDSVALRQRERLSRAVKRLACDLYASDAHLIMELLQNADDNAYDLSNSNETTPAVFVIVSDEGLLFLNNERGFSEKDIRAICDIAASSKVAGQTGRFGVGFKSVFLLSDTPYIFSKGIRIKFDANDKSGLGHVLPHWLDFGLQGVVPEHVFSAAMSTCPGIVDSGTAIWLPVIGTSEKVQAWQHHQSNRVLRVENSWLLFLKQIRTIVLLDIRSASSNALHRENPFKVFRRLRDFDDFKNRPQIAGLVNVVQKNKKFDYDFALSFGSESINSSANNVSTVVRAVSSLRTSDLSDVFRAIQKKNSTTSLSANSQYEVYSWLVRTSQANHSKLTPYHEPQTQQQPYLTVAIQIDANSLEVLANRDCSQLFSTLPVRPSGLRFQVQAPFKVPASREDIQVSPENTQLLGLLPSTIGNLLLDAAKLLDMDSSHSNGCRIPLSILKIIGAEGEAIPTLKETQRLLLSHVASLQVIPCYSAGGAVVLRSSKQVFTLPSTQKDYFTSQTFRGDHKLALVDRSSLPAAATVRCLLNSSCSASRWFAKSLGLLPVCLSHLDSNAMTALDVKTLSIWSIIDALAFLPTQELSQDFDAYCEWFASLLCMIGVLYESCISEDDNQAIERLSQLEIFPTVDGRIRCAVPSAKYSHALCLPPSTNLFSTSVSEGCYVHQSVLLDCSDAIITEDKLLDSSFNQPPSHAHAQSAVHVALSLAGVVKETPELELLTRILPPLFNPNITLISSQIAASLMSRLVSLHQVLIRLVREKPAVMQREFGISLVDTTNTKNSKSTTKSLHSVALAIPHSNPMLKLQMPNLKLFFKSAQECNSSSSVNDCHEKIYTLNCKTLRWLKDKSILHHLPASLKEFLLHTGLISELSDSYLKVEDGSLSVMQFLHAHVADSCSTCPTSPEEWMKWMAVLSAVSKDPASATTARSPLVLLSTTFMHMIVHANIDDIQKYLLDCRTSLTGVANGSFILLKNKKTCSFRQLLCFIPKDSIPFSLLSLVASPVASLLPAVTAIHASPLLSPLEIPYSLTPSLSKLLIFDITVQIQKSGTTNYFMQQFDAKSGLIPFSLAHLLGLASPVLSSDDTIPIVKRRNINSFSSSKIGAKKHAVLQLISKFTDPIFNTSLCEPEINFRRPIPLDLYEWSTCSLISVAASPISCFNTANLIEPSHVHFVQVSRLFWEYLPLTDLGMPVDSATQLFERLATSSRSSSTSASQLSKACMKHILDMAATPVLLYPDSFAASHSSSSSSSSDESEVSASGKELLASELGSSSDEEEFDVDCDEEDEAGNAVVKRRRSAILSVSANSSANDVAYRENPSFAHSSCSPADVPFYPSALPKPQRKRVRHMPSSRSVTSTSSVFSSTSVPHYAWLSAEERIACAWHFILLILTTCLPANISSLDAFCKNSRAVANLSANFRRLVGDTRLFPSLQFIPSLKSTPELFKAVNLTFSAMSEVPFHLDVVPPAIELETQKLLSNPSASCLMSRLLSFQASLLPSMSPLATFEVASRSNPSGLHLCVPSPAASTSLLWRLLHDNIISSSPFTSIVSPHIKVPSTETLTSANLRTISLLMSIIQPSLLKPENREVLSAFLPSLSQGKKHHHQIDNFEISSVFKIISSRLRNTSIICTPPGSPPEIYFTPRGKHALLFPSDLPPSPVAAVLTCVASPKSRSFIPCDYYSSQHIINSTTRLILFVHAPTLDPQIPQSQLSQFARELTRIFSPSLQPVEPLLRYLKPLVALMVSNPSSESLKSVIHELTDGSEPDASFAKELFAAPLPFNEDNSVQEQIVAPKRRILNLDDFSDDDDNGEIVYVADNRKKQDVITSDLAVNESVEEDINFDSILRMSADAAKDQVQHLARMIVTCASEEDWKVAEQLAKMKKSEQQVDFHEEEISSQIHLSSSTDLSMSNRNGIDSNKHDERNMNQNSRAAILLHARQTNLEASASNKVDKNLNLNLDVQLDTSDSENDISEVKNSLENLMKADGGGAESLLDLQHVNLPDDVLTDAKNRMNKVEQIIGREQPFGSQYRVSSRMELGRWGEEFVFRLLEVQRNLFAEVNWVNQDKELGQPFDVTFRKIDPITGKIGVVEYIEVKTTASANRSLFEVSHNEWQAAEKWGKRFHIYRVFGGVTGDINKHFVIPTDYSKVKVYTVTDPHGQWMQQKVGLRLAL